ncbi:3'-5' exonuclease [Clostridium grantii]|uniref:3'-5' exonuclease n=1 Tax=Clostridium grantii TaxID=40575 RepID=UPI0009340889|nr:3'-5' exonuclease [Clostridium grantii]
MNYIVFDLEFNSGFNENKITVPETIIKQKRHCLFEIIHIGAVKLDENFRKISGFNELVKPQIYHRINPFVENLTGITMDSLANENHFNVVYNNFLQFMGDSTSVLCVWGLSDIKELFNNVEYYKLNTTKLSKEYINVQFYASKYFNYPKGTNIGLSKAVDLLNIESNNNYHNAFYDACYTSEVLKKIYNDTFKIDTYCYSKNFTPKSKSNSNSKVCEEALFNQFEKMYHRKITTEEKSMIKLAYMMGKTNQFTTN